MRRIFACAFTLALACVLPACSDDASTPTTRDAGADVQPDTDTSVDATADAVADAEPVDMTETPCGPDLTCTSGEVCVEVCECCGVFVEDPSAYRSSYRCMAPDPECEGRPSECIDQDAITPSLTGDQCHPNGNYSCMVYCA